MKAYRIILPLFTVFVILLPNLIEAQLRTNATVREDIPIYQDRPRILRSFPTGSTVIEPSGMLPALTRVRIIERWYSWIKKWHWIKVQYESEEGVKTIWLSVGRKKEGYELWVNVDPDPDFNSSFKSLPKLLPSAWAKSSEDLTNQVQGISEKGEKWFRVLVYLGLMLSIIGAVVTGIYIYRNAPRFLERVLNIQSPVAAAFLGGVTASAVIALMVYFWRLI